MKNLLLSILALCSAPLTEAALVAHFPMDLSNGQVKDVVSGNAFDVIGNFTPENVAGVAGKALRLDGYSSYVDASLNNIIADGTKQMTFSLWAALECYPIIQIDQNTSELTAIASCLDESAKKGFGFFIGFDGRWAFKTYIGGWPVEVNISTPLPRYQWNNLVAVVDCDARTVTVYNNGEAVGTARCSGTVAYSGGSFRIGRTASENFSGPFVLNCFNGVIDEIKIWDEAISQATIQSWTAENTADLSIPASRFSDDIMRPRFHGMPDAAWTNECHGMTYANGRYHVFFQKNANGPYMARLHWGHISSENLYDWQEEQIALTPGDSYDIKGCWSGCVFTDQEITGGKPNIIYTGVDYAKAYICQASPVDDDLIGWQKLSANPIIDGKPSGLSDDFRDPYFFRNGDNAYIIVGSSKNGVGTTTLHRYNAATATWSNDGTTFFTGANASQDGTFWEMSNITPMADGKWLFTTTPLGTSTGVHTIYRVGSINADGTFAPATSTNKNVELISRDGYGLLSPTIYQHDGKTIAMGIVPDKLASEKNYELGWAHCYSLPREWSLNSAGELVQKPYSGLEAMRSDVQYSRAGFELNGEESLSPVDGREAELLGVFTVGSTPFGFRFFKSGNSYATVSYNPASGMLTADFSALNRWSNDGGVYNGVYSCSLPEFQTAGSELKMNIFIDHSIVDIFINDRWATSIRVFPTDTDANGIEAFADGAVQVKQLSAWTLSKQGNSGIRDITVDAADADPNADPNAPVNVYDVAGNLLRSAVPASTALQGLTPGLYLLVSPTSATTRLLR
jgi:beta-fructofuranosidase